MSLDSYTTQRLKLRLKKHFPDKIVFHQPYDRTISELLYSSAISLLDVINSAYKCNAAANERMSCEQPSVEMVDCRDGGLQILLTAVAYQLGHLVL